MSTKAYRSATGRSGQTKPRREILLPRPGQSRIDPRDVRRVLRAVHVQPGEGNWNVVEMGPDKTSRSFPTREDAMRFARELRGKGREIILHLGGGEVVRGAEKNSAAFAERQ